MATIVSFDKNDTPDLKEVLRRHLRSKGVEETLTVVKTVVRDASDEMFNHEQHGQVAYTFDQVDFASYLLECALHHYRKS